LKEAKVNQSAIENIGDEISLLNKLVQDSFPGESLVYDVDEEDTEQANAFKRFTYKVKLGTKKKAIG